MSNYPQQPSYGTSYGSRDQANPPYLPPYSNQYMQADDGHEAQGHMASNYDTSMSAYAYNRALPAFSAAAVASGVPPLPIYQGWNQDATPLPPFTTPHNSAQYSNFGNNTPNGSQYYPTPSHQSYLSQPQSTKRYEQRELSEGEFEDAGNATNTPPVGYGAYSGNNSITYKENMQHAGYSRAEEFNPQQSYTANNYQYAQNPSARLRRQQSDSYSPYVSPAVVERDDQYTGDKHSNTPAGSVQQASISTTPGQHKPSQNAITAAAPSSFQGNGYHNEQGGKYNSQSKAAPAPSTPTLAPTVGNSKTVAESRKKAEAAILNLLPLDIRYQTYIDEGFREEYIGPLFDGLKVPRSSGKSSNSTPSRLPLQTTQPSNAQISNANNATPTVVIPKAPSLVEGGKESVTPAASGATAQPAQSTASAPKSAAMTEKEKTLQSKMEALRKSREKRALAKDVPKPAEKAVEKSAVDLVVPSEPLKTLPPAIAKVLDSASESPSNTTAPSQVPNNPIPSKSPAQTPVPQPRQQPSIPGLFLASNNTPTIPGLSFSNSSTPVPVSNGPRKRPVADDFNDTPSATAPFKRPFGHHRNDKPLVINVSDEEESEDEDVAMDLESTGDQNSPMQLDRKMSGPRSTVPQGSVQLLDRANKPFTPPPFSSANNTPPIQTNLPKPLNGKPRDLRSVETEMEELRRKIAEAEAKKKAKQQTPSRARTPQVPNTNVSGARNSPVTNGIPASKTDASMKMQQMITIAQVQVNSDQQKLVDAQAVESEKAAELRKNELEQKRLLREKNAEEQSLADAKVLQSQTRLEEVRALMAEAEANYQKSLADKQKVKEEAERLEREAEADLQEKKDRLEDLASQKLLVNDDRPKSSSQPAGTPRQPVPSTTPDRPSVSTSGNLQQVFDRAPSLPIVANADAPPIEVDQAQELTNGTNDFSDAELYEEQPEETQTKEDHQDSASTNQALEAALQEAVRAEADLHAHGDEDQMDADMDMENSYAPDPNHLAPESSSSVVLENEGSPDYSPVLNRTLPEVPERESDDYEPPEATAPIEAPVPDSPPFSPAPPQSLPDPQADESMDIDTFSPAAANPSSEPEASEIKEINLTQASSESKQNGAGELLPSVIGSSPKLVEVTIIFTTGWFLASANKN
ncbi:hypothetical protein BDZ45DRAFT_673742 [Acephala macrosclerotiorum]|nr:hypothetical protein BDZ45DRAFT_673742 [Acephala macrosclerotiorum]